MESVRQTTGTAEDTVEKWQMTGSCTIIASTGFENHYIEEPSLTFPVEMDMRAGPESWYAALEQILLSDTYLQRFRNYHLKKLRAQKGSFERGRIWEEQI